jgi:hypothetical protein
VSGGETVICYLGLGVILDVSPFSILFGWLLPEFYFVMDAFKVLLIMWANRRFYLGWGIFYV